jgi:hypothetical protein
LHGRPSPVLLLTPHLTIYPFSSVLPQETEFRTILHHFGGWHTCREPLTAMISPQSIPHCSQSPPWFKWHVLSCPVASTCGNVLPPTYIYIFSFRKYSNTFFPWTPGHKIDKPVPSWFICLSALKLGTLGDVRSNNAPEAPEVMWFSYHIEFDVWGQISPSGLLQSPEIRGVDSRPVATQRGLCALGSFGKSFSLTWLWFRSMVYGNTLRNHRVLRGARGAKTPFFCEASEIFIFHQFFQIFHLKLTVAYGFRIMYTQGDMCLVLWVIRHSLLKSVRCHTLWPLFQCHAKGENIYSPACMS